MHRLTAAHLERTEAASYAVDYLSGLLSKATCYLLLTVDYLSGLLVKATC